MKYSVVVPAYNEEDSVAELHAELAAVLNKLGEDYEIIFVDDGSTDATATRLVEIEGRDEHVRVLAFIRNSGKSAAYMAALEHCAGERVITLDADLQDDPGEIPKMLAELDQGSDLVIGWKQRRLENEPAKTVPSRFFNWMIKVLFGLKIHDSNSGFRVMTLAVARSLQLYGDLYRFIPELAHVRGFTVAEVGVQHRKRRYGRSKYGAVRFWTGLLDLLTVRFITGYTQKPLHFFGTVGLVPFLVGVGLEVYVLVRRILGSQFRTHIAAIILGVMLILVGLQLVATGLIGEMIAAQNRQPGYVLRRSPRRQTRDAHTA